MDPSAPLTRRVPVAEIKNYGGGFSSVCTGNPETTSEDLYAVWDEVAVGRMR